MRIDRLFAVFGVVWLLLPTTALAICCKCYVAGNASANICLTDPVNGCADNQIIAKNLDKNPKLKDLTCDPDPLDLDSFCKPFSSQNASAVCNQGPTGAIEYAPQTPPAGPNPAAATFQPIVPKLSVPIPGVEFSSNLPVVNDEVKIPYAAQYISAAYKYLTGISVIAAAIMIVYGGFLYIIGGSIPSVKHGKQILWDAIIGMVLIFSAFTILQVVNPATLALTPITVPLVKKALEDVSQQVSSATGQPVVSAADFLKRAQEKAKAAGGDKFACFVYGSMLAESNGKMAVVGHDEDYPLALYPVGSRQKFLTEGKKYSGETFEARPCSAAACQPGKEQNDDHSTFDLTKPPEYGLDWRFSHGFGSAQSTIYPKNGPCPGKEEQGRGFHLPGGTCYTIPELMDADKQIEAAINTYRRCWASTNDGSDAAAGYVCYGGGSVKADNPEIIKRAKNYADCAASIPGS